ncbi:CEI_1a_G0025380.mRNA.1.CDS.1 [Saccharomyces cerevisiae]|nr:CEI_1a_G0025380.mRNA.1.CDS.1 [Saccharomyces cerevisiae]CAI7231773.1 CEI_1a_G0025380.mRNA.1.CDS.1 [Saccharomyces cerevisiae]
MNFLCEGIVLWCLCVFVCGGSENANYRVPRCALKKPFSRACDASILVKKRTSELNPHSEAYCLSLYSVFSKRSPWKKYF